MKKNLLYFSPLIDIFFNNLNIYCEMDNQDIREINKYVVDFSKKMEGGKLNS
jgi:hypothetical protein